MLHAWDEFIHIFASIGCMISPVIVDYFTVTESPTNSDWKNDYIRKNNLFYHQFQTQIDPWYQIYRELLSRKGDLW